MGYLGKYWRKYRRLFLLSILCVTLEAVCDLLQPRVMSGLVDNGAAKGDLDYVLRTGLLMLGIAGTGALFVLARNVISSRTSQDFGAQLRLDLFTKIQSLSADDIDGFEAGSLVTRLTNDVTQLQNFINGMMRVFFKAPVLCVGAICLSASLDPKTMYVIVPVILLVTGVIGLSTRLAYPRFAKVQDALDRLNTTMREYLAGIRLVKAFRRFGLERGRFSTANDGLTQNTIRANRVLAVFSPCMALGVNLGVAAILFFGGRWVGAGEMKVGQIMAFVAYMTQILTSLNMISNVLNLFVRVKASNERIAQVMGIPPAAAARADGTETGGNGGPHIEFCGVGFAYKGSTGQAALEGLSFSVEKGQTLGVIGPTGSGKSTLAALLVGFYPASSGEIRVCGAPLDSIPAEAWRARVAFVPQAATLFTGTIRENILWGKEDATDDEIEAAARAAQAHGFISAAPEGYDTLIGQGGVNLSGGQKQRVSIARALARRPEVLILDDCTSALDVLTEAAVRRALRQYPMTCVLITQRISTVMAADRVLVLENGRQVGLGSHGELMETCPEYRSIYRSQLGERGV